MNPLSYLIRRGTEGSSYAGLGVILSGALDVATGNYVSGAGQILGGVAAILIPEKIKIAE